jgi:pimeloyl-ACP methyl ester carboxylesterase
MAKKSNKNSKSVTSGNKQKQTKKVRNIQDCIEPLYMDGLQGRMLRLPPPVDKKREILLIYGHHASLERMFGMAEFMNRYGGVTIPDLPGFGGMEPFYKLGQKPTLDNFADYLAAFVKLRYKRRRVTIMGFSFGFVIVTRMLQRYPELVGKVDMLVSFVGFVHGQDIKLKPAEKLGLLTVAQLMSWRMPAWVFKHVIFRPMFVRMMYTVFAPKHAKFQDANEAEKQARLDFEAYLWQCNDIRTRGYTGRRFTSVDLCNAQVALPVFHVAAANDHYFDNDTVEQHLNVVYSDVQMSVVESLAHAPTVVADAAGAAPYVPQKLRKLLARN